MQPFEGFLESVSWDGETVLARFVDGVFDPSPQTPPVLLLAIRDPVDAEGVDQWLRHVQEQDGDCWVNVQSDTQAYVATEHGDERTIVGKDVVATQAAYEVRDLVRIAKLNRDEVQSLWAERKNEGNRYGRVFALLRDQLTRVSIKLQGHEPGSTARTLYEQHASFLRRLLAELEDRHP